MIATTLQGRGGDRAHRAGSHTPTLPRRGRKKTPTFAFHIGFPNIPSDVKRIHIIARRLGHPLAVRVAGAEPVNEVAHLRVCVPGNAAALGVIQALFLAGFRVRVLPVVRLRGLDIFQIETFYVRAPRACPFLVGKV